MAAIKDLPNGITENQHGQKDLRVLSLFSGCGGMDLGFEGDFEVLEESVNPAINPHWQTSVSKPGWLQLPATRFNTVFANDIREDAKRAWEKYFSKRGISPSTYHLESIVDVVKKYKMEGINVFPPNIDVVTGGFPCQDFSLAGKRQGLYSSKSHTGEIVEEPSVENRGQLYIWMREVISIVKPKVFVAENVKGLVNLGDVKEIIENDFRNIGDNGYVVIPAKVLQSAEYGVPQSRERVIFYGFRKDALKEKALAELLKDVISQEYDPYPLKTHYLPNDTHKLDRGLKQFVTVADGLKGLAEPTETLDMAQQRYAKNKFMGKHCQGQNEVNLEGIAPTIRSEHHGNIEFRRLAAEHGGRYVEELAQGKIPRRLTVRECARLQTFPDDYEFVWLGDRKKQLKGLSQSSAYKIIGNAVPPLLGFHIAKRLEDNWLRYFK